MSLMLVFWILMLIWVVVGTEMHRETVDRAGGAEMNIEEILIAGLSAGHGADSFCKGVERGDQFVRGWRRVGVEVTRERSDKLVEEQIADVQGRPEGLLHQRQCLREFAERVQPGGPGGERLQAVEQSSPLLIGNGRIDQRC